MRCCEEIVPLEKVLAYSNSDVVGIYLRKHGGSRRAAEKIFGEMLKWVYLVYRFQLLPEVERTFPCWISQRPERINEMWHTFILCTSSYVDFCNYYFNGLIAHESANAPDFPCLEEEERSRRERYFEFVVSVLGEQTFLEWFLLEGPEVVDIQGVHATNRT